MKEQEQKQKQEQDLPAQFIVVCLLTTGVALIGMIRYTTENNAFKLWIPDNSDFVTNYAWLEENSPPDVRYV